jgi:serine/threonine protein kinase
MSEKLEIICELGAGGFATTYKARVISKELLDEVRQEVVAMKVPHRFAEKVLKDEIVTNAALFVRLKRVSSPNLVQYLTFDTFLSKIVMLMEYVPDSLRHRVGRIPPENSRPNPPMSLDQALSLMTGILNGLVVIHKEGFLHRDIKPENILLDGDTPKICDLGISAFLSSASSLAHSTAGTPCYMSPEVIDGSGATFPADIWSAGVVFYELLTGVLPFGIGCDTPRGQVYDRIRSDEPLPPSHYTDIPPELDRIVLKCLQKESCNRFPTAGDLLAALDEPQKPAGDSLKQTLKDLHILLESGVELSEIENRLNKLCTQYPDSQDLKEFLGEVYIRYQHYHAAIDALKEAVEGDEDSPMCYWHLAIAYERIGEFAKAYRALNRAMRIGLEPGLQRHAANWRQVLQKQGNLSASTHTRKG